MLLRRQNTITLSLNREKFQEYAYIIYYKDTKNKEL